MILPQTLPWSLPQILPYTPSATTASVALLSSARSAAAHCSGARVGAVSWRRELPPTSQDKTL